MDRWRVGPALPMVAVAIRAAGRRLVLRAASVQPPVARGHPPAPANSFTTGCPSTCASSVRAASAATRGRGGDVARRGAVARHPGASMKPSPGPAWVTTRGRAALPRSDFRRVSDDARLDERLVRQVTVDGMAGHWVWRSAKTGADVCSLQLLIGCAAYDRGVYFFLGEAAPKPQCEWDVISEVWVRGTPAVRTVPLAPAWCLGTSRKA
jgi:hypothetical protein